MTSIAERLRAYAKINRAGGSDLEADLEEGAAKEIERLRADNERLRAALREIAEIKPRTVEVQTDYGTDTYKTLVDDKAISIARRALEAKDD